MGTVLRFRKATDDGESRAASEADRPAEIIIFPGIRYERHTLDLSHRVRSVPARD